MLNTGYPIVNTARKALHPKGEVIQDQEEKHSNHQPRCIASMSDTQAGEAIRRFNACRVRRGPDVLMEACKWCSPGQPRSQFEVADRRNM